MKKLSGAYLLEAVLLDTQNQLDFIADLYHDSPEFRDFINNPTIDVEQKLALTKNAFEGKVTKVIYDIIIDLVKDNDFSKISDLHKEFKVLYNKQTKTSKVTVTSRTELSEAQYKKISENIKNITKSQVVLVKKIDPSIIGGVIIDYNGKRLDGSIKTKLEQLRYHED